MSEITVSDAVRLNQLEATIKKGSKAFIEVGLALAEIRDSKLYRVHFFTFDAYCQEKWGFKKRRAYDLIESAETAGALSDEKCSMVHNQRQARALSSVPEPDREKVLEAAKAKADEEERPMTAQDIKDQWDAANPPDDAQIPSDAPADSGTGEETKELQSPVTEAKQRTWTVSEVDSTLSAVLEEFRAESTTSERARVAQLLRAHADRLDS